MKVHILLLWHNSPLRLTEIIFEPVPIKTSTRKKRFTNWTYQLSFWFWEYNNIEFSCSTTLETQNDAILPYLLSVCLFKLLHWHWIIFVTEDRHRSRTPNTYIYTRFPIPALIIKYVTFVLKSSETLQVDGKSVSALVTSYRQYSVV